MFKFNGVHVADNYHLKRTRNSIAIVNASPFTSSGSQWIVLAKRYANPITFFADSLALRLSPYKHISDRLRHSTSDKKIVNLIEDRRNSSKPLQSANSQICGLNCIFIAHYVPDDNFSFLPDIKEIQFLSFNKHMK